MDSDERLLSLFPAAVRNTQDGRITFWAVRNALSIDVAIGALAGGVFAALLAGSNMHWSWYISLPVSVWLLYTFDHLADAWKTKGTAASFRHRFHQLHFHFIAKVFLFFSSFLFFLACTYLPEPILFFGLCLGGLCSLYFLLNFFSRARHFTTVFKEISVAAIYTTGIWGPPLLMRDADVSVSVWIIGVQFFLLAWTNLILFSNCERKSDEIDRYPSFSITMGKQATDKFTVFLISVILILTVPAFYLADTHEHIIAELLIATMSIVLVVLFKYSNAFQKREIYRSIGDGIFLIPFSIFLL